MPPRNTTRSVRKSYAAGGNSRTGNCKSSGIGSSSARRLITVRHLRTWAADGVRPRPARKRRTTRDAFGRPEQVCAPGGNKEHRRREETIMSGGVKGG